MSQSEKRHADGHRLGHLPQRTHRRGGPQPHVLTNFVKCNGNEKDRIHHHDILDRPAGRVVRTDKYPETGYSEGNVEDSGTTDDTAITTREALRGQLTAMYNYMKGDLQSYWYQYITMAEARTDNAYGGNMGEAKVVAVESNNIDSDNEFAQNMWNYSMTAIDKANQVICNIDGVKKKDPTLTDTEYREWLSGSALLASLHMGQHDADVRRNPDADRNTARHQCRQCRRGLSALFPASPRRRLSAPRSSRTSRRRLHECPRRGCLDKFRITKGFAHGVMARFYAPRQFRDLVESSPALFGCRGDELYVVRELRRLVEVRPQRGHRGQNTSESIFEVQWAERANGAWIYMMFHRDAFDPRATTPGRNGARRRATWRRHTTPKGTPNAKTARSSTMPAPGRSTIPRRNTPSCTSSRPISPVYVMRLADIMPPHAEALANLGDATGAADLVDQICSRAKIAKLTDTQRGSAEEMRKAVLHGTPARAGLRRLPLVRPDALRRRLHDARQVCDGVNVQDVGLRPYFPAPQGDGRQPCTVTHPHRSIGEKHQSRTESGY